MHRSGVDATFAVIPTWVLESGVSDRAIRVYLILRTYADRNGEAWPSRATIAARCSCSTDTIDRALDELVRAGAVTVEHRTGRTGAPTSNLYTLRSVPPAPPTLDEGLSTGGRTRAAGVAAPVRRGVAAPVRPELDPVELEDPQPPRGARGRCDPTNPTHPRCRGCGTAPRQQRAAARAARPAWCGVCDPDTRLLEVDVGQVRRCHTCHPLTQPTGDRP